MHNLIQRRIAVTPDWQPLTAESLVASVDLSCPPMNAGVVFFHGDDGSEVPWIPGEWHQFAHVDLGAIRIRGTPGDAVTVIGGTW